MTCGFCWPDSGTVEHRSTCVRNEPDAKREYDRGWLDGRRGRECASEHRAYVAGWLRGDSAYDAWFNGEY